MDSRTAKFSNITLVQEAQVDTHLEVSLTDEGKITFKCDIRHLSLGDTLYSAENIIDNNLEVLDHLFTSANHFHKYDKNQP